MSKNPISLKLCLDPKTAQMLEEQDDSAFDLRDAGATGPGDLPVSHAFRRRSSPGVGTGIWDSENVKLSVTLLFTLYSLSIELNRNLLRLLTILRAL